VREPDGWLAPHCLALSGARARVGAADSCLIWRRKLARELAGGRPARLADWLAGWLTGVLVDGRAGARERGSRLERVVICQDDVYFDQRQRQPPLLILAGGHFLGTSD